MQGVVHFKALFESESLRLRLLLKNKLYTDCLTDVCITDTTYLYEILIELVFWEYFKQKSLYQKEEEIQGVEIIITYLNHDFRL